MRFAIFSIACSLLLSNLLCAQSSNPLKADDYLTTLNNSRDALFDQIIEDYEGYLAKNPSDVEIRIEHCEFIRQAFYDSYDDYNPLEEEYEESVRLLLADFPTNHQVLLYQLDNCWGDSAIRVGTKILDMNLENPGDWADHDLAIVHKRLANTYDYQGTPEQVLEHAMKAQRLNDTLDLTYLEAQQYEEKNLYSKAVEILLSNVDSTGDAQNNYRKARMLLELGQDREALQLFELVKNDTSVYMDNGELAQALIVNEKFIKAREYLLRDLESSYNKSVVLHDLIAFDFKHSPNDTLVSTYKRLMDESFHNDTFGMYRFLLLFKAPFQGWRWNDLLKLLYFLVLIVVVCSLPYLYVLPIDFLSRRFGINHDNTALSSAPWTLTDFWIISALFILIDVFTWMLFSYPSLLASFFSDMYIAEDNKISIDQANEAIVFFLMMFIMVVGYLKKTDYQFLLSKHWKVGKSIGLGVLCAFLLRTIYFALSRKGFLPGIEMTMLSSVMDYLKSINQYYHPALAFLFAVILVPFYEEYIFRGIFLNSMDRRIKFIAANVIQSVLFALVHENWSLFLFYFFTGLITGYLVKKSNSLLPALSMHATNNLLAFIAIMRM